jgi:hypothetical protein
MSTESGKLYPETNPDQYTLIFHQNEELVAQMKKDMIAVNHTWYDDSAVPDISDFLDTFLFHYPKYITFDRECRFECRFNFLRIQVDILNCSIWNGEC